MASATDPWIVAFAGRRSLLQIFEEVRAGGCAGGTGSRFHAALIWRTASAAAGASEAATPTKFCSWTMVTPGCGRVQTGEGCAKGRWAQHAAVEHAGAHKIGRVFVPAGDDVARFQLGRGLFKGSRDGHIGRDGLCDFTAVGQFAEADRGRGGGVSSVRARDFAIHNGQLRAIHVPLFNGQIEQGFTRGSGGAADLRRHGGGGPGCRKSPCRRAPARCRP